VMAKTLTATPTLSVTGGAASGATAGAGGAGIAFLDTVG
jgi:hypothetical protein